MNRGSNDIKQTPPMHEEGADTSGDERVWLPNEGVGYASERWVRLVAAVVESDTDCRTVDEWARAAGVSSAGIRAWCRAAGVSAKPSLDFARLLRVTIHHQGRALHPFEVLDVLDERTMHRLLRSGGITSVEGGYWPSLDDYLRHQTFVRNPAALSRIAALYVSDVAAPR